jgi:hypothetical protein
MTAETLREILRLSDSSVNKVGYFRLQDGCPDLGCLECHIKPASHTRTVGICVTDKALDRGLSHFLTHLHSYL